MPVGRPAISSIEFIPTQIKMEEAIMIVVFGATGNIGSAVAKELQAKGARFKCAVRDPDAAGGKLGDKIELVQADLSDRASVDAAVSGAERVFMVCGHSPVLSDLESNAIEAAQATGVSHFLKVSGSTAGITPDAESVVGRAHYAGEQALKASGMGYTILQPNLFFQTLLAQAPMIAADSKMALPLAPDAPLAMIDTRDIGAVGAAIMTSDGHEGQTYYLSGAASSLNDFAAELTKQLGRDIAVMTPPLEAAKGMMEERGMPDWLVTHQIAMMKLGATGGFGNVSDNVQKITGNAPRTLAAFVSDYSGAFQA
jgi:uncharacterized protein YbjT (DUF2867 family)